MYFTHVLRLFFAPFKSLYAKRLENINALENIFLCAPGALVVQSQAGQNDAAEG